MMSNLDFTCDDIILHTMKFMDINSLINLSKTSKRYKNLFINYISNITNITFNTHDELKDFICYILSLHLEIQNLKLKYIIDFEFYECNKKIYNIINMLFSIKKIEKVFYAFNSKTLHIIINHLIPLFDFSVYEQRPSQCETEAIIPCYKYIIVNTANIDDFRVCNTSNFIEFIKIS